MLGGGETGKTPPANAVLCFQQSESRSTNGWVRSARCPRTLHWEERRCRPMRALDLRERLVALKLVREGVHQGGGSWFKTVPSGQGGVAFPDMEELPIEGAMFFDHACHERNRIIAGYGAECVSRTTNPGGNGKGARPGGDRHGPFEGHKAGLRKGETKWPIRGAKRAFDSIFGTMLAAEKQKGGVKLQGTWSWKC